MSASATDRPRRARRRVALALAAVLATAVVPAAAHASRWVVQPTPNLSGRSYGALDSVACVGLTQCVAVGETGDYGPGGGLAEVYGDGGWTPQDASAGLDDDGSVLLSVSCPGTDDCTAVGTDQILAGPLVAIAEHWDGSTWSQDQLPGNGGPPPDRRLLSVSCTAPTQCTAVGQNMDLDRPFVVAMSGTTWSKQWTGIAHGELTSVSCTAPNACTAVGRAHRGVLVEHWDGQTWSRQPAPNPGGFASLESVSCTAADRCTAVGAVGDGTSPAFAETLGARGGWRLGAIPSPTGATNMGLNGVSCTPARCVAVGSQDQGDAQVPYIVTRPHDGSWHVVPAATPAGLDQPAFAGVTCPSEPTATSCVAVGRGTDPTTTMFAPFAEVRIPPA